jgi:predicted phage terminase large subunit-like protein
VARRRLTAEMVEAFSLAFLSPNYDNPQPPADFHRDTWERYCSDDPACATAAPRGHAKSTSFTHAYCLANVCFRIESYLIILGASEEKALEHLQDIATELRENDELRAEFKISKFLQDTKTDIIVECTDGWCFRIVARGSEQKIRGTKWRGKRPGLIIGDDLEDDEQIENKERRKKLKRWFLRAAKQALRKGGRIRIHGTILHQDSLLALLMKAKSWNSRLYKAHKSVTDFSGRLWPQQFSEDYFRRKKQEFVDMGDAPGYSQEYLNDPRDDETRYLLADQFHKMKEEDHEQFMVLGVGCDFAVATGQTANRTVFVVGGKRSDNRRAVLEVRRDRWDTKEWVDEIFSIDEQWHPEYWFPEDGVIWKAVWPAVKEEMKARDRWLNFIPIKRTKDKAATGRLFQREMKGGAWLFDKEKGWYQDFEEELLDFSADAEALLDDQFDAIVNLSLGFSEVSVEEEDEMTDEEVAFEQESLRLKSAGSGGRSLITGY